MFQFLVSGLRFRRRAIGIRSELVHARQGLRRLGLYLAAIGALHVLAMMLFEGLSLGDAAWLTATTATTVGYGDSSAASAAGRWSTVVLIYAGGIFVLGKGVGDYFDYRATRKTLRERGRWRWHLKDHVLFVNAPSAGAERYFETLVRQLRQTRWGAARPVLILSDAWPDGLPAAFDGLGIVHVHGRAGAIDRLEAADARDAAAIVLLATDESDAVSDGGAFDVVHRLVELGAAAPIVVECVEDRNRVRLRRAGASAVIRPMRGYPEMTVRALVAPGSEEIIENLFTPRGDECMRFDVEIDDVPWGRLAAALLEGGVGTAIAYARVGERSVVTNPGPGDRVTAEAVYAIVKEGCEPTPEKIRRAAAAAGAIKTGAG